METVYIKLDKPPAGKSHARLVEGRAAARNWDRLAVLARELSVKPLQDFVRSAPKGTREYWHRPSEAVVSIGRLLSRIATDKTRFEDARLLLRDLADYENILSAAQARGSRFQFVPEWEDSKQQ